MTYSSKTTVYLDNAASSFPKPTAVVNKVAAMLRTNTANAGRSGHRLSQQAAEEIFAARTTVSEFFGISGSEENVVFTSSATQAINTVLKGLDLKGRHIIISDLEHNSVYRPTVYLAKSGVYGDIARVSNNDDETVENFKKLIRHNTALIFVTHASNVTGKILPIKKLGRLCKERGILFGVDASQTAGHMDIDMKNDNIDILCTSGHKGLFGPQGTGLLIVNGDIKIAPLLHGGTGSSSLLAEQPMLLPESLESGTMNAAGIAGLAEGIKFIEKNKAAFRKKEQALFEKAYDGLMNIDGVTIFSPRTNNAHVIAFSVDDLHSDTITSLLDERCVCVRGGFHCAALCHRKLKTEKNGLVRVSMNGFNTESDIVFFLKALRTSIDTARN